jgi:hypothetical protein
MKLLKRTTLDAKRLTARALPFIYAPRPAARPRTIFLSPSSGDPMRLTHGNYAPICDGPLLSDGMRFVVPSCRLQFGDDEFSACIGFVRHARYRPPETSRKSRKSSSLT